MHRMRLTDLHRMKSWKLLRMEDKTISQNQENLNE